MGKLRGVNLGGWLVAERWIRPSLFEGTDAKDEYSFLKTLGGAEKIRRHHKEFITEADFAWLAGAGINAVRIPVGYWILDGDDPYIEGIEHLDNALSWAKKYGLVVLISMHGAHGSQNGRDHSGRIGRADWYKTSANRRRTVDVLERLARHYKDAEALWGIELLNEPKMGVFQLKLRRFYRRAAKEIARASRPGLKIVFHDGFTPRLLSGAVFSPPANPVVMDIHWYHFAYPGHKFLPIKWYFRLIAGRSRLISRLSKIQPIIIGEWSMVLSSESLKKIPEDQHQALMDDHAARQMKIYRQALGWFYWTYKTEGRGLWNFRSLVEDERIDISDV